jgi:hypothetical protein
MAVTASRRPLTAEVRVKSHVGPFETCGYSGAKTGNSASGSVVPCQY